MGRNSNPTRGSTIRHVVHIIAAGVAAAATLAAGMLVAGTANAATMRDPSERVGWNGNPGLSTNLGTITFSNGASYPDMEQSLGVVDRVNGKNAYCIQADVLYTGEDDDQHDVQYHADEVSRLVHVFSEQMDSHADQQDYERESGQQEKPVPGFSGGGEGPFDQRSVHDIILGTQPVLVECQRDDVGQGCEDGGFLSYGDLSDHVPDSSERSVPPRRRSRPR